MSDEKYIPFLEQKAIQAVNQRDEIYEALIRLMASRKAETPRGEVEEHFNNAVRVVEKYRDLMESETWSEPSENTTVRSMVDAARRLTTKQLTFREYGEEGELNWVVIAAVDDVAKGLLDWSPGG